MLNEFIELVNEPKVFIGDPSLICPACPIETEEQVTIAKAWVTMLICMGLKDDSSVYAMHLPWILRVVAAKILRDRLLRLEICRRSA